MIRELPRSMTSWLAQKLREAEFANPYFEIDLETYGIRGVNVETWVVEEDGGEVCGALYRYYNTLQLVSFSDDCKADFREISRFTDRLGAVMLSGDFTKVSAIAEVSARPCTVTAGTLMRFDGGGANLAGYATQATSDRLGEVAQLIASDPEIGANYDVATLEKQLLERSLLFGCRSYVISIDNRIVSCMTSYAEGKECAVLGGLVTDKKVRGMGYGRDVMLSLVQAVVSEKKVPYLYCYKPALIEWYTECGWTVVAHCGKAEWC